MKSLEQKIAENIATLKEVKEKRTKNMEQRNSAYSSLDEMYDESGYDMEEYTTLVSSKDYFVKEGAKLHKQEEKLIKKLIKQIKRRKIEPDDELKQLLNLN